MTIDEAIKHCEEVAEEQEKLYRLCPASESGMYHCDGDKDGITLENGKNKGCQKCAEEHRQLAEWLKELKAYREQSGDAISREQLIRELNAQMAVGAITRQTALDMIIHLLSVTPQQSTGRWINSHIPESTLCECSACGFTCGAYSFNYCPNCGAKMEVEDAD